MLPILQIGPLALQTPGLALLLGVWLGLSLAEKHAARNSVSASKLYNLAFLSLIAAVIGARLVYVLRFPEAFLESPLSLFSLNPGLLDGMGGILAGSIAALVYAQRKRLGLWPTLDALTPALAVLMVGVGVANLASGNAFGAPTSLPWGIELWGEKRHPAQVYEILAAGIILAILWPGKERLKASLPGDRFLQWSTLSLAARLLLEAWRGDSILLPGGLRLAQVAAWLILAACLWIWYKRHAEDELQEMAAI